MEIILKFEIETITSSKENILNIFKSALMDQQRDSIDYLTRNVKSIKLCDEQQMTTEQGSSGASKQL